MNCVGSRMGRGGGPAARHGRDAGPGVRDGTGIGRGVHEDGPRGRGPPPGRHDPAVGRIGGPADCPERADRSAHCYGPRGRGPSRNCVWVSLLALGRVGGPADRVADGREDGPRGCGPSHAIHVERASLNDEAVTLAKRIQDTFEELV